MTDPATVNLLFKLAHAALDARPGRTVIVTDDGNFPADRYVPQGIACRLRVIRTATRAGIGETELVAALGA